MNLVRVAVVRNSSSAMVANRLTYLVGLMFAVLVVLPKGEELQAQVRIVEHGPFSEMLDKYAEINRDPNRRLNGYRVQILATTDRLKLEEAKSKFERIYPYAADWKHEPPYYKLRTGAFTDRGLSGDRGKAVKKTIFTLSAVPLLR